MRGSSSRRRGRWRWWRCWCCAGERAAGADRGFAAWGLVGAVAQIGATLLLLHLFRLRNFAVGNTFAKTETVQAVLFGFLLLGDRVGAVAAAGSW